MQAAEIAQNTMLGGMPKESQFEGEKEAKLGGAATGIGGGVAAENEYDRSRTTGVSDIPGHYQQETSATGLAGTAAAASGTMGTS